MVPHKDGFADQAAILSLGSDTMLEFWVCLLESRHHVHAVYCSSAVCQPAEAHEHTSSACMRSAMFFLERGYWW